MRLIRPDFKITREHGQFVEKGGILFTALYHPSALLRDADQTARHQVLQVERSRIGLTLAIRKLNEGYT